MILRSHTFLFSWPLPTFLTTSQGQPLPISLPDLPVCRSPSWEEATLVVMTTINCPKLAVLDVTRLEESLANSAGPGLFKFWDEGWGSIGLEQEGDEVCRISYLTMAQFGFQVFWGGHML